jgi:hypothetical protein
MTKLVVEDCGWVSIVVGLDWHTKKLVGHYISQSCLSKHWLAPLDMAVN